MIQGLIFDFDGTIIDTETPAYRSWQEVFSGYGYELPLEVWSANVGTLDRFDPVAHLEHLTGGPVERDHIRRLRGLRKAELTEAEIPRPGVAAYLREARERDLRVAVASSSGRGWVETSLARHDLLQYVDAVCCADGDPARAKPNPVLYLEALERLRVSPDQAVAIEDSPSGIAAAKRAGLFCVAVPNSVTAPLDMTEADLLIASLSQLPLDALLAAAAMRRDGASP